MDPLSDRTARTPEGQAAALARVALGDRSAFALLYRATRSHLFGVILRIQPDRTQAEDILQDVFITLWRTAATFDAGRSQPLTWLSTIARNRAIDSLRRTRTEVRTVSRHATDADGDETDLLDTLPDEAGGPLEQLQKAADARELAACLARLDRQQRQCLALAYYQGLSHAEVAEHLAQPLGSVKSWVRRALIALKDCLARAAGPGAVAGRPN